MNLKNHFDCRTCSAINARLLAVIPIMLILYGCGGTTCPPGGCLSTAPIKVDSNYVFSPSTRLAFDLTDSKLGADLHTGDAIEFGIAHTSGNSRQYIAGYEQVVLNNNHFAGPQNLRNEFSMYYADLSYRWRKFPWDKPLGFELAGGLGIPSLDLTVSAPSEQASGNFHSAGVQGAVGVIWRLNPDASIQVRMVEFTSKNITNLMHANPGVNSMQRYELSYAKALGKNLTLRAGYADWTITGYGVESDFKLHSSGPTLVLAWDFDTMGSEEQSQPDRQLQKHEPHEQQEQEQQDLVLSDRDKQSHERSEPLPAMTLGASSFTTGYYATIGPGQVRFTNSPVNSDPYGTMIRIGGGYNFNSYTGLEIGYSTGKATAKYNGGVFSSTNTMEYSSAHIAAVAIYPYSDQFNVFAKLGQAYIALEHSLSSTYVSGSGSANKSNTLFGIGWQLNIGQHFGIRVQYEDFGHIPLKVNYGSLPYDVGVHVFSASGIYKF